MHVFAGAPLSTLSVRHRIGSQHEHAPEALHAFFVSADILQWVDLVLLCSRKKFLPNNMSRVRTSAVPWDSGCEAIRDALLQKCPSSQNALGLNPKTQTELSCLVEPRKQTWRDITDLQQF